jgi:cobalamin biosynthesis Mg chelatase CobN
MPKVSKPKPKKAIKETKEETTTPQEEQNVSAPVEKKPGMMGKLFSRAKSTNTQPEKGGEMPVASSKKSTSRVTNEESVNASKASSSGPSAPVVATPVVPKSLGLKKLSYFDRFGLSKDRDHFIENLSMLVLSGMPLVGALTSIVIEERNPRMKKILEGVLAEIEGGSPLWKSFERTGMFRGYTISLIRIGEESGKFAENLKVVALQEEKDREFRSKVKSALMYPVFVLVLTAVVGIGISWFILPKLAKFSSI